MHQTFYIDIDEEISSVIDRLNKSMVADNYFVVPKRAIFLQSIVNLKLLKREADKSGKNVVIVTQDEVGASMARRSGIDARLTLEGLEAVSDVYSETDENSVDYENTSSDDDVDVNVKTHKDKQKRLNSVGSDDYYDLSDSSGKNANTMKTKKSLSRRIPINPISKELQTPRMRKTDTRETQKEKDLEKMFSSLRDKQDKRSVHDPKIRNKKIKRFFFAFIAFCMLALIGVAVYLFVPSAKIVILPNILKNKIDVDIHGAISAQGDTLGIRVIDKTQSVSLAYDVSGKSAAIGKKAHGSVVIYNEYGASSQALVATTRLESAEGKIFRLVKGVTVPGTTVVDGSIQPGAIEAEIIADQAGSDFNIDPTRFSIPGFAGGPKFNKFYAKSSAAMVGGTSDGDNGVGVSSVTKNDIDNAKAKTEAALKDKIVADISSGLGSDEIVLPMAEKITITRSVADVKVGDMVSSFNYTVEASVRALVFSGSDVKKIVRNSLDRQQRPQNANEEISKIEYGIVNPDFDNSTLDLKVHAETTVTPNIDSEQIKKELLGKNVDQLTDILKKYPSVKNVNVQLSPTFISYISQYPQRVDIQIDNSGQ